MTLLPATIPDRLRQARLGLLARRDAEQARYKSLSDEVGRAKTRVEWQPEVQSFLDALQQQEHERTVGAFERLLTALLQDVLPGTRQVVLELYTEKGAPALDVYIRKGSGQALEDAYESTGGAVTNVLSAGLRMIALVRSGQRPFLVLDEADCWIKPELAPRFASVVRQAADDLGLQVLMISHHDETLFDGILPYRLRLERGAEGLTARWGDAAPPDWAAEQPGLRSIRLENFQSHTHTFLPLAPGVTLLHGDNDLGKSAVNTALRAVFYGISNDTYIHHGATSATVTLDMGPDHLLEWRRAAKGRHKIVYTWFTSHAGRDAPMEQTAGAREVPAWMNRFGIGTIDGLDVQLSRQKLPVFLLDLPASQRAKALAVGSESGHVQAMMTLDRQDLTDARTTVRQGEKALETAYRRIQILASLDEREASWKDLEASEKELGERHDAAKRQIALDERWGRTRAARAARLVLRECKAPAAVALAFQPAWLTLARRWTEAARRRHVLSALIHGQTPEPLAISQWPAMTEVHDRWSKACAITNRLLALRTPGPDPIAAPRPPAAEILARRWTKARATVLAAANIRTSCTPVAPVAGRAGELTALASRWARATHERGQAQNAVDSSEQEMCALDRERDEQFPVCPTCAQPWQTHSSEHSA